MTPSELATPLVDRLHITLEIAQQPVVVGIDGRSGSGKSTIAAEIAGAIDGTVIEGDLFYAGGSADTWAMRSAAEKAELVIDWRQQRLVLEQLLRHGFAEWHPFDWDAPDWDVEPPPLAVEAVRTEVAPIVILEGAYSCRPEMHDLLTLRVLLEVPRDLRRRQLLERAGEDYRADWEARWSVAEDHYFGAVMPADRFDLILGHDHETMR